MSANATPPKPPPERPPESQAPAAPAVRKARWRLNGAGAAALTTGALVALAVSAPWTAFGTQLLLSLVPGLQVSAPVGSLLEDFRADRLTWGLPNGQRLVVDGPHWDAWTLHRQDGQWQIHLPLMGASRMALEGSSTDTSPVRLPTDLSLPLAVRIDKLEIGRIELGTGAPIRDVQARVTLGLQQQHRLDDLALRWDRLEARGAVSLGSVAPLPLDAALKIEPVSEAASSTAVPPAMPAGPPAKGGSTSAAAPAAPGTAAAATAAVLPPWQAEFKASGPLKRFSASATLSAAGQHLDARAEVAPEAAWPVDTLRLQARAFDLAPLASSLPNTALTGDITLEPAADPAKGTVQRSARSVRLQADLVNEKPGSLANRALPLKQLQVSAQSDLDNPERGRLERLSLVLADERETVGSIAGDGQWTLEGTGEQRQLRWDLNSDLKDLQPARLHASAPALTLRGPLLLGGVWPLPVNVDTPVLPAPSRPSGRKPATESNPRATPAQRAASGARPAIPVTAAAPVSPRAASLPPLLAAQWRVRADLSGTFPAPKTGPQWPTARLRLTAQGNLQDLTLEALEVSAGGGPAQTRARAAGRLQHNARDAANPMAGAWQLKLDGDLQDFNPVTWWPGLALAPDSGWQRGPHRLTGQWAIDAATTVSAAGLATAAQVTTPAATSRPAKDLAPGRTASTVATPAPAAPRASDPRLTAWLREASGTLSATLAPSTLAGTAVAGQLNLSRAAAQGGATPAPVSNAPLVVKADVSEGSSAGAEPARRSGNAVQTPPRNGKPDRNATAGALAETGNEADRPTDALLPTGSGANRLHLEGQLDTAGDQDRWTLRWSATQLARLNELMRLLAGPGAPQLDGDSDGQAQVNGRWPAIASTGDMRSRQLTVRPSSTATTSHQLRGLGLKWQAASSGSAELSGSLQLDEWRQSAFPRTTGGTGSRRSTSTGASAVAGAVAGANLSTQPAASPVGAPPATPAGVADPQPLRLLGLRAELSGRPAEHTLVAQVDVLPGSQTPKGWPDRGHVELRATGALVITPGPASAGANSGAFGSTNRVGKAAEASSPPASEPTVDWTAQVQTFTLRGIPPALLSAASQSPAAGAAPLSGTTQTTTGAAASTSASIPAAPTASAATTVSAAASTAGSASATPPATATASSRTWARLDPTRIHLRSGPAGQFAEVSATRLSLLDAALKIETFDWQQGRLPSAEAGSAADARLRIVARLDPYDVTPWLQRAQPDFGWAGDLRVRGSLDVTGSNDRFSLRAELLRDQGDLRVVDPDSPGGPQQLGLKDVQIGLTAQNGRWRITQKVVGGNLGTLEGEQLVQANPADWAPREEAPLSGRVDLRLDQLGNWGRWLPAGWRLAGQVSSQARVSGTWGAPRFSGEINGQRVSVRNVLEGVDWRDADFRIDLGGDVARIEQFSVKGGAGTLNISGQATLGSTPRADLVIRAERFAVLQRVDRRVVVSGQTQLGLDSKSTVLKGKLTADEGRIDFTRSDAPTLGDDVEVLRDPAPQTAAGSESVRPTAARPVAAVRETRRQDLDLSLDLGKAFVLKGRGLNTRLEGALRLTSPANRLSANGTIRAVDGTYVAYGQKLAIDRGDIVFTTALDNPRLDILALRSDLDGVRVGVSITGNAQNPRIRLFSDPQMADNDKLSWLLLGRASDGLGSTDLALLQQAAYALIAGESDSPSLTSRLGLDKVSVRQQTDGDVRATVVSLGKQISRRWYVGYERSLNATTGTWQLIYRIAQRFTLRAQSGAENAVDLIWGWKWGDAGTPPDGSRNMKDSVPQPASAPASAP